MKIVKTIEIKKSAAAVWRVLGEGFADASWIASVRHSEALSGELTEGAPVAGRVCALSDRPDGLAAEETITAYDDETRTMRFVVVPMNAPAMMPIRRNEVTLEVRSLDAERCEVRWSSEAQLKAHGVLMYPLLKLGLGKGFGNVLEELKHFVETGEPHPRNATKTAAAPSVA